MVRIVLSSSHGDFDMLDFVGHADFATPASPTVTTTEIAYAGVDNAFLRLSGDFSSFVVADWTVTGITIGRGETEAVTLTGASVPLNDFGALETRTDFIDAFLVGDDEIVSQSSDDSLVWNTGLGDDTLDLGAGNDRINGGDGIDLLNLNSRMFSADFVSTSTGFRVTSNDGVDRVSNVELLEFTDRTSAITTGTTGNDLIRGNEYDVTRHDILMGGSGQDSLYGGSGRDFLLGGRGDDIMAGQRGNDRLEGGSGDDRLSGGSAADRLYGQRGEDTLLGGSGKDVLSGGSNSDFLNGGSNNDRLYGGFGADTLNGGTGDDTLRGSGGRDVLIGQRGDDLLFGGRGDDVFKFSTNYGSDTIGDFRFGDDLISIGRGADDFADLSFATVGDDVRISFSNVDILVRDIDLEDLQDADNFLF